MRTNTMIFKALKAVLCCMTLALAAANVHAQGNGSPPGLLSPEAGPSSPAHPGRGVVRSQRVAPDKGLLAQLRAQLESKPGEPQTLVLRFFDDATFVVKIDRIESVGLGAISYHGHVIGKNDGHVVIAEKDGNIGINVDTGGKTYQVLYYGAEGYFAREVNFSSIPHHPPSGVPEANFKPVPKTAKVATGTPEGATLALDDGSTMDVMVVYTQAARVAQGGNSAMDTLIALGISQVNSIYANSNIVQRLRLVHSREVTHTEINMDVDLDAITNKTDGILDDVHILRDAYGADFVSLWGIYSDYCGLGWQMGTESATFEAMAFNIVAYDCTSGGTVLAHELGHNMGLKHDNYQTDLDGNSHDTTVTPEGSGTPTTIFYAHGYVDTVHRFRTVMSYNSECAASSFNCFLVSYFSNPAISINSPFDGAFVTTGNASTANERQDLNDTRETTANFRQTVNTSGAGTFVFIPKTYSIPESGGSLTITVARLAGSTGAASVNYATADGTATAGADYLATSGTLSWTNGETATKTFTVPILTDALTEGNETFTVALSGATGGATVGSNGGTATVTIIDDEQDGFPLSCASLPAGFSTSTSPNHWRPVTDNFVGSPCSLSSATMVATTLNTFVNSDLSYTATFVPGNITFNYRVSTFGNVPPYANYGFFEFLVDGLVVKSDTGESGWVPWSQPITAGVHTLTWRFKNSLNFPCRFTNPAPPGGDNCADRAWIDNLIMPTGAAVSLASVASRKIHPSAGTWDRPVDSGQLIGGLVTTEPRTTSGGNHTVVFTFNAGIATPGSVTCLDASNNPIGSCSVAALGTAAIVTVGGITDNKRVKVSLANVNGNPANSFSASLGFLLGDVDGNRAVTASDILAAKGRVGQSIGVGNYADDANLSGTLTSADVDLVKANAGVTLN